MCDEDERILQLMQSVEKEELEEIRAAEIDRERLRRQLFADAEQLNETGEIDEDPIERDGSDQSQDKINESDHDTHSEVSLEDLTDREGDFSGGQDNGRNRENYILGKDNEARWNTHIIPENLRGRVRRYNIMRGERIGVRLPCPKGEAITKTSAFETWKLFFPDSFLDKVVMYTNIWIDKNRSSFTRNRDAKSTDRDEIQATLGLLYLAGMLRSSHTKLEDLWSTDGLGIEYFRLAMSLKRFKFLLRALRFDDIRTRRQRKALDNLAPIRDLFGEFVNKCQAYYALSAYVTVDEMLEAFRGRCKFRQYLPNKPARYGIKMFALCDSRTYYTFNLEVYPGKQPPGPHRLSNSPKDVAIRLIAPISGTGRHVTMDNWYGSIPLAKELLQNHRLTSLSTLKKNKREIPPSFIDSKIRKVNTSLFAYQSDMTLMSYVPRPNKVVLLLSTFHHSDTIDEETGDKQKPIMLTNYNKWKGGVDTVDQMKAAYSVSRKSNRWSLTVFFSMLNIASINSFVILRSNVEDAGNRRGFIKSLGKDLCKSHMIKRMGMPRLPVLLRKQIQKMCGQPEPARPEILEDQQQTGRCYLCSRVKNRKSRTRCPKCRLFMCREHTSFTCVQCASAEVDSSDTEDDE